MDFIEIHDQFYERVKRFILASVREASAADDLVQEAFLKIRENVKVRLHRARKKFKAILEEKCIFEVDERNLLVCEPVEKKNGR